MNSTRIRNCHILCRPYLKVLEPVNNNNLNFPNLVLRRYLNISFIQLYQNLFFLKSVKITDIQATVLHFIVLISVLRDNRFFAYNVCLLFFRTNEEARPSTRAHEVHFSLASYVLATRPKHTCFFHKDCCLWKKHGCLAN